MKITCCYKCKERTKNCHTYCLIYRDQKEEVQYKNKQIRKKMNEEYDIIESQKKYKRMYDKNR